MKPVPISNKIANQWNEFLDYFNEKAYNILPRNGDKPQWELLDTNQGWDNLGYSGGQDFYQKVLDEKSILSDTKKNNNNGLVGGLFHRRSKSIA